MSLDPKHHKIEVTTVQPGRCGAPGHYDRRVTCSCGMDQVLPHGNREDVTDTILYHRLSSLEAVVGMKISIEWLAGS